MSPKGRNRIFDKFGLMSSVSYPIWETELIKPNNMSTLNILIIPEEDMHRFAETDFTVKVAGWSKPRPVYRRGPHLVMDIAVSDCMCNTCVRRFETVLFSMRDRKVEYEVGSWNKSCAVRFTNPGGISDDEICGFLTDRLGIEVSNLEKVAPS